MQEELEAIELERQTIEEQGRINDEEMLKLRQELRSVKESNQSLEERLQEINKDIEDKDQILQEL